MSAVAFLILHIFKMMLMKTNVFNPLTAKLLNLNFHPLEVVSR